MRFVRPLRAGCAIAAVAFASAAPALEADAALTVSAHQVVLPSPPGLTTCQMASVAFEAIVAGGKPSEPYLWIVAYTIDGNPGNTGATPTISTLSYSGYAILDYTLPIPKLGIAPADLMKHTYGISFHVQTRDTLVNYDSKPVIFTPNRCGPNPNPTQKLL